MNIARHSEYLKALGIEIWVPRVGSFTAGELPPTLSPDHKPELPLAITARSKTVNAAARIVIGPGDGDTLLLCGNSAEAATALAADIARSLDCEPVWGWPQKDDSAPALSLQQAVQERLFTRVLVFGPDLVATTEEAVSMVVGSARLIRSESIPVLSESGAARRALWLELSANHWCATW